MNRPVLPEPPGSVLQRNGEATPPETGGDARQRLLELRLQQRRASAAADRSIARRGSATAPMSFAQEGLWFLDRLGGPSAAYNVVRALRLHGPLDVAALEHALAGLVQRHESLRTGFVAHEGAAVQVVMPSEPAAAALRLVPETLSEPAGSAQEALLQTWLERAAAEPFDLARAPLLRVRLLRLHEHEHVLLLVLHHIVSDGWSMNVLARELGALYAAARAGRPSALAALAVQFADYAAWQHQRLQGPASAADLAYWRTQLAGLEALQLPTDRPRAAQPSHHGARLHFEVEPALHARLQALARRENVTLFMLLLAAFQVLLMRYSGQHDVAVGSPVAGRNRAELEGLIGYFVNTLVLRGDLSGRPSFVELLARTRQTCLQAYAHQELPFDRLVAELAPQRELGRNPLYQVSFALQNTPDSAWALQDLRVEALPAHGQSAKFDLSVSLRAQAQALAGTLEYATELFDASTAERLARHFGQLLGAIAEQPELPITRLALLSAQERTQLLRAGNDTAHAHPLQLNLHQLFEAQVQRSPQALAVLLHDEQLSYAELNERANRLAHLLRSHGVGPDGRVGLCMQRSPSMVLALLAILKAGGAYVPLDPQYPSERLAFMLADSQASIVITEQALLANLPADAARTTLCLDEPALLDLLTHQPDSNPTPRATPDHLAYVIYTSGSTGTPKGVAVTHRGICNHDHWFTRQSGLCASDRVLVKTSISFDASVWELFAPLAAGATLVVVTDQGRGDTAHIARTMHEHRVTLAQSVPSELSVLLEEPLLRECTSLRYMVCGGEALERHLARRFVECLPGTTLANCYGPTEASIGTTWFEVRDLDDLGNGPGGVPIGTPIDNARCHILDAELEPVPIGVVGELYIGGTGLARGYLGRPELTAERFVDDPFLPGQRLYRTGDLARYLGDATIDYVGRIDHQVKIRGFRIELGEIEASLAALPGVRQCAVLARTFESGDRQLVAYVACDDRVQDVHGLQELLKQRLPQYMVPAAIVPIDTLPRTPNGKLDTQALPLPEALRRNAVPLAPSTPLETQVAQIWHQLLGTEPIGVHDDFFDLGGHSLLAARLVAHLRRDIGGEVPLRWVFESPTIAGLAARMQAERAPASPCDATAIARLGLDEAPLSAAQEGLWFIDRLLGPNDLYHIVQAHRLHGPLDVAALERALAGLVQRHESLRTGFVAHEGAAVQVVMPSEPAAAALRLVPETLSEPAGSAQEALLQTWLERAAAEPFDLARAPLLRVRLLRLHEHEHVLLLVLHHIVSDGWSMNVLARELGALYAAARAGRPSALAALAVQFADYAAWQHQRLQGPASAADLAYWRTQLAGLEALQLPTDRPRAAQPSHHGARLHFEVEPALHARLQALARRENVTLFMLLLAAFQVLLMRYSGQHDVAVGSPVAGRNRAELEGLIGYFVNTLVLRGDLSGRPSFVELLARTRQTCLQAYAHQELPFDRLVAELAPQRELGRNPLYQVSFALQNTPDSAWALQDLRVEALPAHGQSAKFDLSVSLRAQAQALAGTLEYATELFDASTAERLARHFGQLLGAIAEQPELPITRLALLSAQERTQLLRAGNDTAHAHPLQLNLHQLFEAQVQRSPQALAVLLHDEQLSYAELNERANRLAHLLRSHGVGPDGRVGLCMQRSPSMVLALLAILKAGGAYVPLDPQYPSERLAFMLADSQASIVITEQALLANLPADAARTTLCLDEPALLDLLTHQPDSNPTPRATPDHLAYVIYTSGSTGTPKGVAVTHRAVVNLVVDTDYVRLGPADGVAQASNNSFDAATFEIWGALLNGARLIVVPKEVLLSAPALSHSIEQHRINTMFLTTALFNDHAARSPGLFGALDHLLFGGEAVDPLAVQRVVDARPPARLLHVYGPTETTTFATWHEVRSPRGASPSRVPIGRPLAGARCHILDAELEPVPIGVVGELYIGGTGLARGYLNRPELTAERFVDDPFLPGQRLYRTGDLARYLGDATIDYVGRIDHQVKIRGFRIELGEIEAALSQQDGVARCAVIVREDSPGDKRLVAYVVAGAGAAITPALLRERLAARLPHYMVPASVVLLDALPLTPNGKLDRDALPRPGAPSAADHAAQHEPGDDLERALRRIWEDVLDTSPIGLDQSFFDLGGHSLLAIKLLAAVEKRFGHALGLATLFDAPTIRGQASLLREPQTQRRTGCAVVIQPHGARMPLFFVSGFGGAILPFHRLSKELGPEQPLVVLDINSLGDFDGSVVSLEAIAAQMLRDLRAIQPQGPYHLAGFSLGGKIVYEMAQQLMRAGEAVGLLALLDCAAPGFPRRRSFAVRVALHVRHAMGFEKRQALAYLLERVRRLKKYVGLVEHVEPTVFKAQDVVDRSATLVQAIEARAQPIYDAWADYVPGAYPGRLTLVCAEVRDVQPGVVEDDPEMGWGALVGGGVDVASLPCHHVEMLDPPYAPALAALLSQRLPREKAVAQAPVVALA